MKIAFFIRTIATVLLAASMGAQAEPFFANKDGNLIWDKATGLVWMRCTLGQTWSGTTCTGQAKEYTFDGAQQASRELNASGGYARAADWQMPSVRSLASLRDCSTGFKTETTDIQDGQAPVAERCKIGATSPTVDAIAFPGSPDSWNWSSSPYLGDDDVAWSVSFGNGVVSYGYRSGNSHIRLARTSQFSGSEAALAFPVKLQSAQAMRDAAERRAQVEREAAERKAQAQRDAAERKAQAERSQALKQLHALGARGLYLEAGKAQRNGSVTFVNNRFDAVDLYEMIVDKFPNSEYAVKATDQLTAMDRSTRQRSAAESAAQASRDAAESNRRAAEQVNSNASQRAYDACKIEMDSCYSSTNGKGNCWRDCDRLR